jgi:hypothetical protein
VTLTSIPDKSKDQVRVRFTANVVWEGVVYGPDHLDIPVPMRRADALALLQRRRARLVEEVVSPPVEAELPAVREPVDESPAAPAAKPAAEPDPKPATRRTRRRTKK